MRVAGLPHRGRSVALVVGDFGDAVRRAERDAEKGDVGPEIIEVIGEFRKQEGRVSVFRRGGQRCARCHLS